MMEKKYDKKLKELFKEPPNEFRMMPFWFWNHEMVEKEVQRQIRDHHIHGIGGEFIHPRHGRLTPYMGKRWLENVEAAADQCKELNMPCFLYDEDNWPSGPTSGLITGPYNPQNRGKYLVVFDEGIFGDVDNVVYELDYKEMSEEAEFFAAIALPNPENYPNFENVIDKAIDVSDCVKGEEFVWQVPEGEWSVIFMAIMYNEWNANMNGYIDILRKETVKEFIDQNHKKYANWFIDRGKREYLGDVVPGIFTDEPSMGHVQIPGGAFFKHVVFTHKLPEVFEQMHGYPFSEAVISLFYETGDIRAKHRSHYWETATQMYVDAFYKPIYEFCDQYNWRSTGHVNCEGNFPMHIKHQGEFFKVFEYMHYGGCDQLTEDVRPDYIENIWDLEASPYSGMGKEMLLASKLASSAAHLLGKPRVLVEAFGTSSWDITLASAKRINDYLIATGCDLFVPHDFAYSEDGYRKQDHPASFYHQPYYKHWKRLCDHSARLCTVLNAHSGILNADILLLYPANSFYAEMAASISNMADLIGQNFTHNADCLFRQQLDFELANEDLIINAEWTKNGLKIRDQTFKVIDIGMTTSITLGFAKKLQDFYDNGGKVVANTTLPYLEAHSGSSKELCDIIAKIFGINPEDHFTKLQKNKDMSTKVITNKNSKGGRAVFIQTPLKAPFLTDYYPKLKTGMDFLIPLEERDIIVWKNHSTKTHAAYVMATHKSVENKELYFLTNTSREAHYDNTIVEIKVKPLKVELWDTLTGEITKFEDFGFDGEKLRLNLNIPPYKSYLFAITKPIENEKVKTKNFRKQTDLLSTEPLETIDLGDKWVCRLNNPNGAMLYQKWESSYHVEAGKAWGYPSKRIFKHKFHVSDVDDIGEIRLVIEGLVGDYGWGKTTYDTLSGGDRATFSMKGLNFYVNDERISVSFDFEYEYLDPCWIVTDIKSKVKNGMNEIKMVCETRNHATFHVVTDPWRLIGDFEAKNKDGIPYLSKVRPQIVLKDLNEQGFSRFHGGFSYIKEWIVPPKFKGRKMILKVSDTTDCVELRINGQLHEVLWDKWHSDITEAIEPAKKNTLELVYYGIAQNMLQTNIKPQGLTGKVNIKIFR